MKREREEGAEKCRAVSFFFKAVFFLRAHSGREHELSARAHTLHVS